MFSGEITNRFYQSLCKSDFFIFKHEPMKTEKELNAEILEITMKIQEEYPELSKYIAEIPITIPNEVTPEITIKVLIDYYKTLHSLVSDYIKSQKDRTKQI